MGRSNLMIEIIRNEKKQGWVVNLGNTPYHTCVHVGSEVSGTYLFSKCFYLSNWGQDICSFQNISAKAPMIMALG